MVLAVIGIMSSFAYPSYRAYVVRAHRLDGQMALFDLAMRMEQYYTLHQTYHTATIASGSADDVLKMSKSPQGWYTMAIVEATAHSFLLQATPIMAQSSVDRCQSFTLNHLGQKALAAGPAGLPEEEVERCWG